MLTSQRAKDIGIPNLKRSVATAYGNGWRLCLVKMANRETDPKTFLQASTSCSMDWCSWGCSFRWFFMGGFDGAKMTADQGNHGKSMKIHGNYKQENKENAMENRPLEQWSSFVSSTSTRTRGLFVWMVPGDMCNDQKRALPCSLPMLSSFGTAFNGTVLPQVLMMALTHKPIGRPFAKISRLHLHITKCSRAAFRE